MIHVLLPDTKQRRLSFYLAMEEYMAMRDQDDYFFMWQVDPTVIIGRNQQLLNEVNTDFCKLHNIDIVRRKSGGGCVYADRNNIMFSYITSSDRITDTFTAYTSMVAEMLKSMGIMAHAGGRNDVLINDRKVSGNAFYHTMGRSIVHGTMLYNTDINTMLSAITPSTVKLSSHGVESVRSRVTNLTEHFDLTLDEFKHRAANYLCDNTLTLTDAAIQEIKKIQAGYETDEWLHGKSPNANASRNVHIDGVGNFQLSISLKANRLESLNITGDYFPLDDIDQVIVAPLIGNIYTPESIREVLRNIDISRAIAGLSNDKFLKILFDI